MSNVGKVDPMRLSYHFFVEKENAKQPFSLEDLCAYTGWSISTPRTYKTKKWKRFLKPDGNQFYVEGISELSEDTYLRMMSQKDELSNDPHRPPLNSDVERLVVKSREAAIQALDGYNRASSLFRTETFIVLMVIAWRSLFHAMFEKDGTDYYYRETDGSYKIVDGDPKAWELTQCVKEHFGASTTNPVRQNLEFIIGFRNKIEHRFAPIIEPKIAGECQALVLNYDNYLVKEFGEYYALRETLAVPLQTSNLRSEAQISAVKQFQGKQYDELMDYIETFRAGVADNYDDPRYSFRVFLIPKVGNHASSSDLAFEFVKYDKSKPEEFEANRHLVALIKERQVPVVNAGGFKPGQVVEIVAGKIGREFRVHHHTQAWRMYKVRQSGATAEGCVVKYCQFDHVHQDHVYTQAWIDFLVDKLSVEKEYQRLLVFKEK